MDKKLAIVTGASTGIGKATAIELSKVGFTPVLIARREDKLNDVKNEIEKLGNEAIIKVLDLNNFNEIENLKTLGKVFALVNVAGVWHTEDKVLAGIDFEKFSQEEIINTLNIGIVAPMLLAKSIIPLMTGGGNIVNVSGTFENGAKGWVPYFVGKKAIESFTEGLAEDLFGRDIYVNCISPSDTSTEEYKRFFPQYIEDSISPEEVAKEIVKFCINVEKENGKIRIAKR